MTTRSSRLSPLGRCGLRIMLLATPLLLAMSAYADTISIGFQETGVNGGAIHTVGTGSGTLTIPNTPYGTFIVNQANAQDFAVLPDSGLLNSNALDISSNTAGTLTIWVTAQGLSYTGVEQFKSSFAVNEISGSVKNVVENTFLSPTNGLYDTTTPLSSATFTAIGAKGPFFTTESVSGLYSVTEEYVITDVGKVAGDDNITIDLSGTPVVPEPGSLLLLGSGMAALAGLLYYRRQNKRPRMLISNA